MNAKKWLLALALAVIATAAQSRDGWQTHPVCDPVEIPSAARLALCQKWIAEAKQPDHRDISCCADADALITDEQAFRGGQLYAVVTVEYPGIPKGTLIPIPPNKLNNAPEDGGNPTGHSVTFAFGAAPNFAVLCYFGPTLS